MLTYADANTEQTSPKHDTHTGDSEEGERWPHVDDAQRQLLRTICSVAPSRAVIGWGRRCAQQAL
jgi:hypothetical protein